MFVTTANLTNKEMTTDTDDWSQLSLTHRNKNTAKN